MGCDSLLLVDNDGTVCPLLTAGLPEPVEARPDSWAPPLEAAGDWILRPPAEGGAWTAGRRPGPMGPTGVTAFTGARSERGDWPLLRNRLLDIPGISGRQSMCFFFVCLFLFIVITFPEKVNKG